VKYIMVQTEERQRLFEIFVGVAVEDIATARLEELAFADVTDVADRVRARLDRFDTNLTDRQIASEVRHEALRLLAERRRAGEELPEMATAF
jgi:hypothetical protein